jgi:hypothetical protein
LTGAPQSTEIVVSGPPIIFRPQCSKPGSGHIYSKAVRNQVENELPASGPVRNCILMQSVLHNNQIARRLCCAQALSVVYHFELPSISSLWWCTLERTQIGNLRHCQSSGPFRRCIQGIAGWFHENPSDQVGLLICDDTKNQNIKHNMLKAFRSYRRRLKSTQHKRGLLEWVHDDLYFGDSAYSVGIQVADICTWAIQRDLQKKPDTEYMYETFKHNIFFGIIEPNGKPHGSCKAIVENQPSSWIDTLL